MSLPGEQKHARETSVPENGGNIPLARHPGAEAYSIHPRKTKWLLVGIVALAGFLSPFPANIYFPAIPTLATAFNVSIESMNLTVTIYLAMQGISPMLWGPLSDWTGRRPIFLICLAILIGSCVGLALTPTDAFWLLLFLRALQAGGCASTIALGAGVVGDVSAPNERGGYFGLFNLGPMLAPCIGPALGGVLSDGLGWRSVFWFLAIFSTVCFLVILLFLPETMRGLVGNGSIPPPHYIYRPLAPIIITKVLEKEVPENRKRRDTVNPFRLFLYADVLLTLFYTGVVYGINYTIIATIASSFGEIYPYLSETSIGLCYLATGGGMVTGSTLTGKMLDSEYRKAKKAWVDSGGNASHEGDDFPIEKARLRTTPTLLMIFFACVMAWGWCLERKVSIAGPLLLQFVLGYSSISILNITMTLMVDIVPGQSSGVTACTNLVRCSLAALLVSLIDKSTHSIGYGWTYVILGAICALLGPLIYIEICFGPKWRKARALTRS